MTEAFPPPSNPWQKQCWTSLTAQLLLHALLKVMFCKAASCLGMLVLYDSLLSTELKADCRLSVHGASSRATKCTFTPVLTAVQRSCSPSADGAQQGGAALQRAHHACACQSGAVTSLPSQPLWPGHGRRCCKFSSRGRVALRVECCLTVCEDSSAWENPVAWETLLPAFADHCQVLCTVHMAPQTPAEVMLLLANPMRLPLTRIVVAVGTCTGCWVDSRQEAHQSVWRHTTRLSIPVCCR